MNQIKDHYFCGVLAGGVCIKQCVKYTRQCQNKLGVSLSALSSLKRFQTIQCKTHMKLESILWEKIMNKTIWCLSNLTKQRNNLSSDSQGQKSFSFSLYVLIHALRILKNSKFVTWKPAITSHHKCNLFNTQRSTGRSKQQGRCLCSCYQCLLVSWGMTLCWIIFS